ncbi:MAG: hypothetical protein AAF702_35720 [Chloroflexota bacterium]
MNMALWLSNLASLLLGMTISAVLLFTLSSRFGEADSAEGCLTVFIGVVGGGISTLLYLTAIAV